jgi:hypothetical protein
VFLKLYEKPNLAVLSWSALWANRIAITAQAIACVALAG